jgi:hypothetical protein
MKRGRVYASEVPGPVRSFMFTRSVLALYEYAGSVKKRRSEACCGKRITIDHLVHCVAFILGCLGKGIMLDGN